MMKYIFLVLIVVCGISFQNCSPVHFTSLEDSLLSGNTNSNSFNNGEGYGGKLGANYYRFRPDFKCEGKEGPVSQIQTSQSLITITESKELACLFEKRSLEFSDLDVSIFQRDIVGYKEGIFEGFETAPNSIPANLVEVWCRDRNDEQAIETITHFDRYSAEAVTKIFYATQEGALTSVQSQGDFPVSRIVSSNRVTISNGSNFELVVFRDQPSSFPGQLKASLKAIVNGKAIDHETNCRLSGSLDPNLWPARQIVDLDVSSFKISENRNTMAFTASMPKVSAPGLFAGSTLGNQKLQVTPTMKGKGVDSFEFSPQGDSLVFWADPFVPSVRQLLRVNLDGTNLRQMNSTLMHESQATSTQIKFSADGKNIFYLDGVQEKGGDGEDVEMFLRSVPLAGGEPKLVSLNSVVADDSVIDFAVKKSAQKIAYIFGFSYDMALYLADDVGSTPAAVPKSNFPTGWIVDWNTPILSPDPGEYFFAKFFPQNNFREYAYYAIKSNSVAAIKLPTNWEFSNLSVDGRHVMMKIQDYDPKISTIRDLKIFTLSSKQELNLRKVSNPFFSSDSKNVVASKVNSFGEMRGVIFSLSNQSESDLCVQAEGNLVALKENSAIQSILLVVKNKLSILEFWERQAGGQCLRRNSLPFAHHQIEQIEFSPNQKSVLVKTQRQIESQTHQELFFIPMNGQSPHQIDSATHQSVLVSQMYFLKDSKYVLFVANSIQSDQRNVFIWRIPED